MFHSLRLNYLPHPFILDMSQKQNICFFSVAQLRRFSETEKFAKVALRDKFRLDASL